MHIIFKKIFGFYKRAFCDFTILKYINGILQPLNKYINVLRTKQSFERVKSKEWIVKSMLKYYIKLHRDCCNLKLF